MSTITIRRAREDELKTIQDLNYQLFLHDQPYDSNLDMNWPYEKAGEDYFRNAISGKDGVCFVAQVNGEVVGYVAGGMIKPYSYRTIYKESELGNMLVKEAFRGKKIGEKLFEAFLTWSKEHGAQKIKVSASAANTGAIKFYQRVGFVPYASELEFEVT